MVQILNHGHPSSDTAVSFAESRGAIASDVVGLGGGLPDELHASVLHLSVAKSAPLLKD